MANLTAKMRVQTVDPSTNHEGQTTEEAITLALAPADETVTGTPWVASDLNTMHIVITNPAAFGIMPEGADFMVTLIPVGTASVEPPADASTDPATEPDPEPAPEVPTDEAADPATSDS